MNLSDTFDLQLLAIDFKDTKYVPFFGESLCAIEKAMLRVYNKRAWESTDRLQFGGDIFIHKVYTSSDFDLDKRIADNASPETIIRTINMIKNEN